MEKLFLSNRKDQKIAVIVDQSPKQTGLAFVMHGLSGFKEQLHIRAFAESFKEKGFTVIRFDATNTFGESDGDYADATVTNYYEDLEDVIGWAKTQPWYQEPFALAGHSLGGICVALYAEKYPERVKAVAPISTVISGKLSMETDKYKNAAEEWKRTGWDIEIGHGGRVKRLKWSHMEDRLKYDLMPQANKLTMPVLLIVGEKDESTLPAHQRILYESLPAKKEIHIIKDAPHTFRDQEHLAEVKNLFLKWIDGFSK